MIADTHDYAIALQHAIEANFRNEVFSGDDAKKCPFHANKLNEKLSEYNRLLAANAELAEALAGYVRAIAGPTGNRDHEGKESVMAVIRAADDVARAALAKHHGAAK